MSRKFFTYLAVILFFTSSVNAQLAGYKPVDAEPLDIRFQDDEGKNYTLKDFKGKIVLINLWAPNCAPCVQELPSIQKLTRIFTPDELVILPICTTLKHKEPARTTFELANLDRLKLYFDHEETLMKAVKSKGIPVTLIVDKQGNIVGRLDGATEWDHYENVQLINDIIEGKLNRPLTFFEKLKALVKKWVG